MRRTSGASWALAIGLALCASSAAASAEAAGLTVELDSAASSSSRASGDASADKGSDRANTDPNPREKNPAHYEIAAVSFGAYQAWALAGRWLYFGIGGGVGPPLYRYSKFSGRSAGWDPTLDIVYGNGFIRVAPVRYVDLDVGPRLAIVNTLYDVGDRPHSGVSYGGYADLRVGSKNIKVGPRFEFDQIAYSDRRLEGWSITPLLLRITH